MFGLFKKNKKKAPNPPQPDKVVSISPELKEQIRERVDRLIKERKNKKTHFYPGRQVGKSNSYGNKKYSFSNNQIIGKNFDKKDEHIVVSKKRARRLAEYENILDDIAKDPMVAKAWQKFQTFRKMRKE